MRFVEPLRGYEDYAITTDRAAIGNVDYRYPLIIDRGVAALWLLPSSFVRELDLDAFADGAVDQRGAYHAAAGASLTLDWVLFRFPFTITYQIARRLRDDDAIVQIIGLGGVLD